MRVLLVDDEVLPLEDMRMSLSPTGFEIDTATDPETALQKYRENRYDAVISDVRMPGMDGITLLRKLREYDGTARVIIVTAYGDLETAKAAINNRAYAFFGKPISFPELIETLKQLGRETKEACGPDCEKLREENERLKSVYRELLREIRELRDRYKDYGYGNA